MNIFENIIVADVDGVMLYWEQAFGLWMAQTGYVQNDKEVYSISEKYDITQKKETELIEYFNSSFRFNSLPPMRDAIKYIKMLHENHGYVFHCISAVENVPHVHQMRLNNLQKLFGETTIQRLVLSGTPENKKETLRFYSNKGCYWIEDVPKNAEMGHALGLEPILIRHHYNKNYANPYKMPIVDNWSEIYDIIVGH